MASFTIKPISDQKVWDKFLKQRPEANFLQSWQWGQFHEALKKTVFRCGFYQNDKLVGVMLSVVEPARRGRYITVAAGPIAQALDREFLQAAIGELRRQAKAESCVFVRLRPQLIADEASAKLFKDLGFRSAPIHLHAELTRILDTTQTDAELMADMRKGTRYELRQAAKIGIKVTTSTNPADMKAFYDRQIQTAQRQKFVPFSYQYLVKQFEIFADSDQALLFSATYAKQVLAQAFVIFYGQEAVYHYGASTEAGRIFPGAYAVQWAAIKEAQRRKMSRYNFWGVAPHGETKHRFFGTSVFKRGFGGQDVAYLHAQDLVINRPHYLANLAIETARAKIRRV